MSSAKKVANFFLPIFAHFGCCHKIFAYYQFKTPNAKIRIPLNFRICTVHRAPLSSVFSALSTHTCTQASNKVAQMMTLQFQNRQLPVLKDLEKQARQRIATYTRQLNEIETSGDDLQGLEDLDVHVLELTECKLADQQQHRAVEQLIETAEKGVIGAEEMETFNQLLATSKRLKKTARSKAKLEQVQCGLKPLSCIFMVHRFSHIDCYQPMDPSATRELQLGSCRDPLSWAWETSSSQ